jgi:hypothetical protein
MVREGLAWAFVRYSRDYVDEYLPRSAQDVRPVVAALRRFRRYVPLKTVAYRTSIIGPKPSAARSAAPRPIYRGHRAD